MKENKKQQEEILHLQQEITAACGTSSRLLVSVGSWIFRLWL